MTINGARKLLNTKGSLELDELTNKSISGDNNRIKSKLKKIINIVKEIKKLK